MNPSRRAVDTNVPLDLADRVEDVLDALAVMDRRLPRAGRLVLSSVLDELAPPVIATRREIVRKFFR